MKQRLDVGGVIRRVFSIYVEQASVLMPAAAAVFVFTGILSTLLTNAGGGLRFVALLIGLVATTLFTGMVVELVSDVRDGRRDSTPGKLLRAVWPVIGSLLFVAIAAAAGVLIGFIFLIIPGLILLTLWAVAAPVVVLERPPGLRALGRSRELVSGNGWQVFGVLLVLDVMIAVIAAAIELAADAASTGVGLVVTVVVGVLSAPFPALAAAVMYFDLRAGGAPVPPPGAPVEPEAPAAPVEPEEPAAPAENPFGNPT